MKFCQECGAQLIRKWLPDEQCERNVCQSCGVTHYENPKIIVCAIVCWRDKLLLCRRARDPGRNKWMVPGGFLECGETLEACAARETIEETGVRLNPSDLELYSVVNMTAIRQVLISFRATLTEKPPLCPGPECLDVNFFSETEFPMADFAWRATMGDGVARFFNELRLGEFTIQLITLGSDAGTGFTWRSYAIR